MIINVPQILNTTEKERCSIRRLNVP